MLTFLLPPWQELGAYPEDVFEGMGDTPVAAASLGQVRFSGWGLSLRAPDDVPCLHLRDSLSDPSFVSARAPLLPPNDR